MALFWERLLNDNVDRLLRDPEKFLLKHMRYDHDFLRDYQRRFGTVLRARGLNLYKLVAQACGEVWDNEDEEKACFQPKKEAPMDQRGNAVSLDHARKVGVREDQGKGGDLPGCDGASEENLQKKGRSARSRSRAGTGGRPKEEEEAPW